MNFKQLDELFIKKIHSKNLNFTKRSLLSYQTVKRNIVTKLELLTSQGLYFLGCIKGYFFKGYSIERDRG